MSMAAKRNWRCDRCSLPMGTDLQTQPHGWGGVIITEPPLKAAAEAESIDNPRTHLCRQCVRALRAWLTTAPGRVAS